MTFPTATAGFAALLGLIYVGMSVWVMAGRISHGILQGDGGDPDLQRRMRAHANFGEYVPLALGLIGLYEASGGSRGLVVVLLLLLLIGRLLHPFGMYAAPNSPRQFACRGGGIGAKLLTIFIASSGLLVHVL